MSLSAGTRLGPYEIVAPLGAGGMGEVYRARDTRLGREVAIKVLPAEFAADPERLRRFEQEAKAVSALNHPHIVTLYEVGTSEHGPYLVLEKIEGQSLRELLHDQNGGALPVKRVLILGAQIAEGLAKAHAAGIVHRDLKPENVMVTDDGFAKVLDFGLAKLVYPELEAGAIGHATTLVEKTGTGMIVGTLGYLSPEQAVGKPADFRSDQFALGALLYELATGERPFRRETVPESLTAVIREEPEPLRAKNAALPVQLGWIVERCLSKDPNDRYGSTRDLARDLADLRDHLSEIGRGASAVPAAEAPLPARGRLVWASAGLALGAAVAVLSLRLLSGTAERSEPPSYRSLNFRLGAVTGAKFGPDGKTVYYSAAFGAEPSRVYVTRLEGTASQRLDLPPAILRSVSSKGELALTLTEQREATNAQGTLARVPSLGGTPRALIDDALDADWAPDGEQLAVLRLRGERRLEFPIGTERFRGVLFPRLSPKGDRIAFSNPVSSAIEIHGLDGRLIVKHEIPFVYGMAWKRDGAELWFTGSESLSGTDRALYALSHDGRRRLLARAPGAMNLHDVAPDGKSALVTTGSGRSGIVARGPGESVERALDLFGRSELAGLSADGRWILANEQRELARGTYLLSSDGTKSVRLDDGQALGLSPDGAWALVLRAGEPRRLVLVPTGPGAEREVPLDASLTPIGTATWSSDGRRLFVAMSRTGDPPGAFRVYLREEERPWRAVTPLGGSLFAVSSEGEWVAARDAQGAISLHPVAGGAPRALPEVEGMGLVRFSPDGRWLFVRVIQQLPAKILRLELATGRLEPWRELAPSDPAGAIFVTNQRIADDEASYAYSVLRVTNELFLVEGLE